MDRIFSGHGVSFGSIGAVEMLAMKMAVMKESMKRRRMVYWSKQEELKFSQFYSKKTLFFFLTPTKGGGGGRRRIEGKWEQKKTGENIFISRPSFPPPPTTHLPILCPQQERHTIKLIWDWGYGNGDGPCMYNACVRLYITNTVTYDIVESFESPSAV